MNPQRGDAVLSLGGIDYTLRLSFAALAEIEQRTGQGLLPLARRFSALDFGGRDVVAIIGCAIKAGGREPPADLGDLVLAAGLVPTGSVAGRLLMAALAGRAAGDDPNVAAPAGPSQPAT